MIRPSTAVQVAFFAVVLFRETSLFAHAESAGSIAPSPPKNEFYIDPEKGSPKGNGSKANPWRTLAEVVQAGLINGTDSPKGVVHAGDIVYLMTGNHGSIRLNAAMNKDFITIQAFEEQKPVINGLSLQNCSKWVFRGFIIENPPMVPKQHMLSRFIQCTNIIFDRNVLYSQPDVTEWKSADWLAKAAYTGVKVDGTETSGISITNNTIQNVLRGMVISGDNILIAGNTIDYYADDGIDFTSSNTIIHKNRIINHYGKVEDGNHNDGIQGWTVGGKVGTNIVIDSNYVISSDGTYPTIPLVPTGEGQDNLQGIAIYDGEWKTVVVTNNVVMVAAFHGISLSGMTDVVVSNNTVIKQDSNPKLIPWLAVLPGRSKNPPRNAVVRNNIAHRFNLAKEGVVDDHNISLYKSNTWSNSPTNTIVANPKELFVKFDPAHGLYDLHLAKGGRAVGSGTLKDAPKVDVLGAKRHETKMDIGAFAVSDK
jgi:hypothetical protein